MDEQEEILKANAMDIKAAREKEYAGIDGGPSGFV